MRENSDEMWKREGIKVFEISELTVHEQTEMAVAKNGVVVRRWMCTMQWFRGEGECGWSVGGGEESGICV